MVMLLFFLILISTRFTDGIIFQWPQPEEDEVKENHFLRTNTTKQINGVYLRTQCALQCIVSKGCDSYNFCPQNRTCELNSLSTKNEDVNLLEADGISFYSVRNESFQIPVGLCATNPCQHEGYCLDTRTEQGDPSYLCLCKDTWRGNNCELEAADVQWSQWQSWQGCSASCGQGSQLRRRQCSVGTASNCYGADTEYRLCNERECPRMVGVNGHRGVNAQPSQPVAKGVRTGKEPVYSMELLAKIDSIPVGLCATNPCQHEGYCLDTRTEQGDPSYLCLCKDTWRGNNCELEAADVQWSQWQSWQGCSASCGQGSQLRRRQCSVGTASNCYGADTEYRLCNERECPRWGEWSPWSECSTQSTCGQGSKNRQRACLFDGTVGQDRFCQGPIEDTTPCDGVDCRGPIKLVNGSDQGAGILSIYDDIMQEWSFVCSEGWTQIASTIACRQLGANNASEAYSVAFDDSHLSKTDLPVI
ncbi:A disintegrin and metalloproteinase with thrombospondin motifs adt-2, partial [Lingula anatina]|uniref:A disintegrin and metalloproteinase with thrombospondin motifs adt-2 n=1 Tax=Lingula anatina TaxID=7574 RepID=A0A1S3IKQ1_LINAN